MKFLSILLVFFSIFISHFSFGQKEHFIDKVEKRKIRKKKKVKSGRTINYDANSLWDAIRPVLGANVSYKEGKAIINTGSLFATGNNFILWVVNGVILGDQIPNNINIHEIEKIKVLRSPLETEKYGFMGSSGVIEISLKN